MQSHIFDYIPQKDVTEILTAFHSCIGIRIRLTDEYGNTILSAGKSTEFCNEFKKHLPENDTCEKEREKSIRFSIQFGQVYCFCCRAGLYNIVFPLVSKNTVFGAVVAGPFLMEECDSDLILDLNKKYEEIPFKALLQLSDHAHQLKLFSPEQVVHISNLLHYLLNSMISGSRELLYSKNSKFLHQSRINESIQMYKNSGVKENKVYPIEIENQLLGKVKSGDTKGAHAVLNDYLGILLPYENYNLQNIKTRLTELCALLSRETITRGADNNKVLEMNNKLIQSILECQDIQQVCYTLLDNLEIYTESIFFRSGKSNKIIKEAAEYISAHFAEDLSLSILSEQLHLNPAYLSMLFKQITGHAFKEYLNQVRVEEAKRLLMDTDYSIIDIAVACGFTNQSYFTKVFKKETGMTPKQFR